MCPLFLGLQLFSNHFTCQHVPTGNGAVRPKSLSKFRFLKLFPSISCVLGVVQGLRSRASSGYWP